MRCWRRRAPGFVTNTFSHPPTPCCDAPQGRGGSQLQGGKPQNLPVNLQGRLLGKSAEHTHERDLVRETQLIVVAPTPGSRLPIPAGKSELASGVFPVRCGECIKFYA